MYLLFSTCTGCSNIEIVSNKENKSNKIIIDKIGIDREYNISSIKDFVNGIVMFDETGRPDIINTNTVIGAHSGYGENAIFNDLKELDKNDEIYLIYENKEYKYIVDEVKEVDQYDLSILNDIDKSILTLLTCKISNTSKRIVVISYLDI
jgi:LPXTG-site transpeptidase (sortase) family protein